MTCVRDPKHLKYYFKTYENPTIKVVDLKKFDLDGKNILYGNMGGTLVPVDITSSVK